MLEHIESHPARSAATARAYEYHCRHLLDHLPAGRDVAALTLNDTESYVTKRIAEGASRHTVKKEVAALTQALRHAVKRGRFVPTVDPSHLAPDSLEGAYVPRTRWLTFDEYRAILAELALMETEGGHRVTKVVRRGEYLEVYVHTGMRKSELFDLRAEHYVPARREVYVPGTKTDTAPRVEPLSERADEIVRGRIAEGRDVLFPKWSDVNEQLWRACDRLRIPRCSPNDLRRTFASWLSNADVPERVIADLLGHTTTTMVRSVYGQISRERLQRAIGTMDNVAGAVADVATQGATQGHAEASKHE